MSNDVHLETESKSAAAETPSLRALQDHLLEHWSQPEAHQAFVEHAFAIDQSWHAATFYRAQLGDPQREEIARIKLGEIQMRAMAMFEVPKDRPPPKLPLWLWIVGIGVCAGLIIWVVQYVNLLRLISGGFETR